MQNDKIISYVRLIDSRKKKEKRSDRIYGDTKLTKVTKTFFIDAKN